jgi:hypothetical protein
MDGYGSLSPVTHHGQSVCRVPEVKRKSQFIDEVVYDMKLDDR